MLKNIVTHIQVRLYENIIIDKKKDLKSIRKIIWVWSFI